MSAIISVPEVIDSSPASPAIAPSFYEFFSGGGMVRAGLGPDWTCRFANDLDLKKGRTYQANWGDGELKIGDVCLLKTADLPETADLAWASFPCQDLSLAGGGAGLGGDRSGTFWPFWKLMTALKDEGRAPRIVALENVCGTLTSHEGKDFVAICDAIQQAHYRIGALVINAALFVPQSRPRLFVVAVRKDVPIPEGLKAEGPTAPWHTSALVRAHAKLSAETQEDWVWWNLPHPPTRTVKFSDLVEADPENASWYSAEETERLFALMSPLNRDKLEEAKRQGRRIVGGVYRRMRPDADGGKIQRAEIRFDDVAGCLRTPAGGSSRQVIVVVDGETVKARLLSSRETARLMGLPDSYKLPKKYNEAYHLTGDGVVVPVVRHLAEHVFRPIVECSNNGLDDHGMSASPCDRTAALEGA
jgi:DNA (cytosine-5)-methyltransferase 1